MFTKRMLQMAPFYVWTACSNATIACLFIPMMTDMMNHTPGDKDWPDDVKQKHGLLAMVGLGFGEIGGAIVYGQLQDRY